MWVQILEKGNGYTVYKMKGMELQETSCHTLEATKVDEIFTSAFERRACLNHYPLHTLTPITQLGKSTTIKVEQYLLWRSNDSNIVRQISQILQ